MAQSTRQEVLEISRDLKLVVLLLKEAIVADPKSFGLDQHNNNNRTESEDKLKLQDQEQERKEKEEKERKEKEEKERKEKEEKERKEKEEKERKEKEEKERKEKERKEKEEREKKEKEEKERKEKEKLAQTASAPTATAPQKLSLKDRMNQFQKAASGPETGPKKAVALDDLLKKEADDREKPTVRPVEEKPAAIQSPPSVQPKPTASTQKPTVSTQKPTVSTQKPTTVSPPVQQKSTPTGSANDPYKYTPETLGTANPSASLKLNEGFTFTRPTKYRHIFVKHPHPKECFIGLNISQIPVNNGIKASKDFISVLWNTGAANSTGRVAILPWSKVGRQETDITKMAFVEAGGNITDFDWNPFSSKLFATGLENSNVQVWDIPLGGLTKNLKEPKTVLKSHRTKISTVDFHPLADNLLVVGDLESVKIWDINHQQAKISCTGITDALTSVSWNHSGSLFVASSKDRSAYVFDPRSSTSASSKWIPHTSSQPFKAVWAGKKEHGIICVGTSRSGEREVMLFDKRKTQKEVARTVIASGSGVVSPFYDEDLDLVFCCPKGEGNIHVVEIDEKEEMHYVAQHISNTPSAGYAALPKTHCNVKECEIQRFVKLTVDSAEPFSWVVPRTRQEFFQDDIFPPTRDPASPHLSSDQWFGRHAHNVRYLDRQPPNMKKVSENPLEAKGPKYDFKEETKRNQEEFTPDKFLTGYFNTMQQQKEQEGNLLPQDEMEGVNSDEWDD